MTYCEARILTCGRRASLTFAPSALDQPPGLSHYLAENPRMTHAPGDHPIETWETEIGRFVVAFAALEHWVHVFVAEFGSRTLHAETLDFQLGSRVKVLRGLLGGDRFSEDSLALSEQVLGDLMRLTVARNLIVHNPVLIDVFEMQDGDLHLQLGLRSLRDMKKSVSLEGVRAHTADAKALAQRLAALFNALQLERQH